MSKRDGGSCLLERPDAGFGATQSPWVAPKTIAGGRAAGLTRRSERGIAFRWFAGEPAPAARLGGGDSPLLLLVPDGLLPMDALEGFDPYREFLFQLAQLGRLALFDRRGIGASQSAARPGPWGLEDWASDAAEVLDACGCPAAVVVGLAEGAGTAVALAARQPARVRALILVGASPSTSLAPLSRHGEGPRHIDELRTSIAGGWPEQLPGTELIAPSAGREQAFAVWLSKAFAGAGDARRFLPAFDLALRADLRPFLPAVRAPTLVVHRRGDAWFAPDHGRLLAAAIPGARYLELPGADHVAYMGPSREIINEMRWFLAECIGGPPDASPPGQGVGAERAARAVLTSRQEEILRLVRLGLSDREIAERMGLSCRTVGKHLETIYRRLGVHNRTAAALADPSLAVLAWVRGRGGG